AESPDSPALQRYYLTTKARYLREQKDDEKSLEVVDKILSSSWVNAEDRSTVSSLRWQALLRLGRIDEGVALIRETLAEWDYPSEKEKEAAIQSTIATELSNAGHSPKTAPVDTADRVSLNWFTNLEKAQEAARAQKKDLLLLFTGSDWCAPCRQLKKQILDTREFAERINDKYVLLELDFPNGTELPQEQVEQNRKLSGQLNNSGYPSIYFADAEILPYGKIVGFGGSETFYNRLDRSLERAAQYRQATQGGFVSAVTSAGTLDQVLSIVPEELIPSGWTPHLERLIAASSAEHPELHAKWSKARDRVQESIAHQERGRRFSKNIATLQEKKGAGASLDDVFAFLDASIEEAQGHPEQIHFFLISKAQTLQEHQEYEKALGNVEELLSATQGRNRESLVSLQQQLLLNLGRFDEGIELVVASLANRKFPSEEARQSFTNSLIARQLTQAGQYTESLKYWQTTNLEEAQDQVRAEGSGRTARLIRLGGPAQPQSTSEQSLQNQPVFASIDFATQSTGRDHELRGRSLLAWSGAGQRGERRQSQKERAALAAVSFRAADRFDLVEQAIAALNLTDEATDTEQATQESLQETLGIAKGSQGDALRYLAGKSTSTVGQGVYLLEAAFAFAREGRTAEAKELAQQAADLDKQIDSKLPDQAGVEYFRKLLGRWSAENKTASRS
ncbi:MAG TPA: thioredoxin family protein, partial [Planctomicrobium sp.]|nr:thioredoxin family protein [Planctomicrobium sp.]